LKISEEVFLLKPGDVLVYVNDRTDWFSRLKRKMSTKYEHVSMYLGRAFDEPMLYESDSRGVGIQSLNHQRGRLVEVYRPKLSASKIKKIAATAVVIASAETSRYDYLDIMSEVLPRLLYGYFGVGFMLKYRRDGHYICSEAVAEAFWRNGIEVVCENEIPLPSDFVKTCTLEYMYEGYLLEDVLGR
jgi:hypothetical protein